MSIVRNTESDLEFEKQNPPAGARNLRRAGEDRGEPPHLHPGRPHAGRLARPRIAPRPSGPGQDHAGQHHRQRDALAAQGHLGSRAGQAGRPGGAAHQPLAGRCALHRRDPPPPAPSWRSTSTPRWRITRSTSCSTRAPRPARYKSNWRPSRSSAPPRAAACSPSPLRGALRHLVPPGVLRRSGARGHRAPLGPHSRRADRRRGGPRRSRSARARHAPHRQRPAAARARLLAMVKGDGRIDLAITRTALEAPKHRLARPRPHGQQDPGDDHREVPRRRPRGTQHHRHGRGRGGRHGGGGIRTVPHQGGFSQRTPRGREATELAYRHLGLAPHDGGETGRLF